MYIYNSNKRDLPWLPCPDCSDWPNAWGLRSNSRTVRDGLTLSGFTSWAAAIPWAGASGPKGRVKHGVPCHDLDGWKARLSPPPHALKMSFVTLFVTPWRRAEAETSETRRLLAKTLFGVARCSPRYLKIVHPLISGTEFDDVARNELSVQRDFAT